MPNPKRRFGPRLKIEVTRSVIAGAKRKSLSHCMISNAVRAQVPWASYVRTDLQSIRISDEARAERLLYPTPPLGATKLLQFDAGEAIEPFRLELKNARVKRAPSVKMRKWRTNQKARKATKPAKPGSRKKPPTLYVDSEREFGMRKMTKGR